eukprot:1161983-Pelagomonas_calceolata.AAC.6
MESRPCIGTFEEDALKRTQQYIAPAVPRGAVKKGQEASADQDSRAQARKIAQAIKATWAPTQEVWDFSGIRAWVSKLWG